jgi:hypothetical protein
VCVADGLEGDKVAVVAIAEMGVCVCVCDYVRGKSLLVACRSGPLVVDGEQDSGCA